MDIIDTVGMINLGLINEQEGMYELVNGRVSTNEEQVSDG